MRNKEWENPEKTDKLVKTGTNVSSNMPYYGQYYCKGR